ncbi:hypothetical protein CPU12_10315 [Malaciobacter molluscorum LMG 25693]|uniref:Copper resistance protein n=1 Tax=Malaciobacter molluscorum LMG 25693 TaxID=870501 RepID=A0A2G1DG18_9BACT|nr:FixH family protein [Malaciobacter molluscorum]AXX91123.1 putative copper resistance protein [Malaciobacter molluscorum LMG 25693]PHO17431.1 hypothetical protein CPU12_10315 [Malaciobacter molluscorum LMG 25693]
MKSLFKLFSILILALGIANADPISQSVSKNGYDVKLTSEKSLVKGSNVLYVKVTKANKAVTNAKAKIKFYMPEMPGMPYMESENNAKLVGDKYKIDVNFSMGGTWQYQLKVKTSDGKIHKIRGSVNI